MSDITTITFTPTARNGDKRPTETFGVNDNLSLNLGEITRETPFSAVKAMIFTVADAALDPDDTINLIHLICHSAKYAGLVKSATI